MTTQRTESWKSAALGAMVFLFWIICYAVAVGLAGGE